MNLFIICVFFYTLHIVKGFPHTIQTPTYRAGKHYEYLGVCVFPVEVGDTSWTLNITFDTDDISGMQYWRANEQTRDTNYRWNCVKNKYVTHPPETEELKFRASFTTNYQPYADCYVNMNAQGADCLSYDPDEINPSTFSTSLIPSSSPTASILPTSPLTEIETSRVTTERPSFTTTIEELSSITTEGPSFTTTERPSLTTIEELSSTTIEELSPITTEEPSSIVSSHFSTVTHTVSIADVSIHLPTTTSNIQELTSSPSQNNPPRTEIFGPSSPSSLPSTTMPELQFTRSATVVQNTTNGPSSTTIEEPPSTTIEEPLSTTIEEPPSTTIEEPPSTTIEEPPSTTIEEPPSTTIEELPSTTIEEPPSTTIEEPPSTTMEEPPSTTIEEPPSTTIEEPPSTTIEEPPSTTIEEPPSTTIEEPPSTTIEEPSSTVIQRPIEETATSSSSPSTTLPESQFTRSATVVQNSVVRFTTRSIPPMAFADAMVGMITIDSPHVQLHTSANTPGQPDIEGTGIINHPEQDKNEQLDNQNEQFNRSLCRCECSRFPNKTQYEAARIFKEVLTNMTVDVTTLSSTRRKKTSAEDNRTSSLTIGIVGILVSSLVIGIVVLADASKVFGRYTFKSS